VDASAPFTPNKSRTMTAAQLLGRLVLRHGGYRAGERAVGLPQLVQNREVIRVRDRYQVAGDMALRPVAMVVAAARDHRGQLAGAVRDTQRLVHNRPPHRRELLDLLLAQLHLVVDMGGIAQRTKIKDAGDRQSRGYLGMIKDERGQMPTCGPAGDDNWSLDAMLAGLVVEPIERAFQLVGDLRQARLRGQRVAAQSRRPTTGQRPFGQAGEGLFITALPIAAVNVNEARRLGIVGGIEIPLVALAFGVSQVEVLGTLLA
jgi:hypothetical protein